MDPLCCGRSREMAMWSDGTPLFEGQDSAARGIGMSSEPAQNGAQAMHPQYAEVDIALLLNPVQYSLTDIMLRDIIPNYATNGRPFLKLRISPKCRNGWDTPMCPPPAATIDGEHDCGTRLLFVLDIDETRLSDESYRLPRRRTTSIAPRRWLLCLYIEFAFRAI